MKDVKEMTKAMESFVNSFDDTSKKEFAKNMASLHRTLQQSFMNVVVSFIIEEAKNYESGNYDLRNEFTCKMAHEIKSFLEKNDYVINENAVLPCI